MWGEIKLIDEEELLERAYKTYYNWCTKNGYPIQQPSNLLSEVSDHGIITLKNSNGIIATYWYREEIDKLVKIANPKGWYKTTINHD